MCNNVIRLPVRRKLYGKFPVANMRRSLRYHKLAASYCKKYPADIIHPTVNRSVIENGINFMMRRLPKKHLIGILNYFMQLYYKGDEPYKTFNQQLMIDVLDYTNPNTQYLEYMREEVLLMGVIHQITYYFKTHQEYIMAI